MRHEEDLETLIPEQEDAPIGGALSQVADEPSRDQHAHGAAAVRIAALFHDLGKATLLFQGKLRRGLAGGPPEADPVRHELHSAAVWDALFGGAEDAELISELADTDPAAIDQACKGVVRTLGSLQPAPDDPLPFRFLDREGSLAHLIGSLILTHHRLPDGDSDHLTLLARQHVAEADGFRARRDLAIAPGTPFWHESWWVRALKREAARLRPGAAVSGADMALRAALMFADHLGSAQKRPSVEVPDHLANTERGVDAKNRPVLTPADSLSTHVERVYRNAQAAFDLFHRYRDRFPALDEGQVPSDLARPLPSADPRFGWQAEAARAARDLCEGSEGGFFGCLMAGTGTGKTRGAPTVLANAALGDARPERRYLRMSLALGLRVLATQSGREYVD